MKNIKKLWTLLCVCILCIALQGCAGKDWSYKDKNYPNVSWFTPSTKLLEADQFKQTAEPIRVLLWVTYTFEGNKVIKDPFDNRTPDWREVDGLYLATKRYLEETGLFQVVEIEDENIQGKMMINIARDMDEKTKALIDEQKKNGTDEKIVYEFNIGMDMKVAIKGKSILTAVPQTNHMFIGNEDSKEKDLGLAPEKFTFSYFNNMDFHTEFVRRYYRQMLFECLKQIENDL